jgi:hypothetical protein
LQLRTIDLSNHPKTEQHPWEGALKSIQPTWNPVGVADPPKQSVPIPVPENSKVIVNTIVSPCEMTTPGLTTLDMSRAVEEPQLVPLSDWGYPVLDADAMDWPMVVSTTVIVTVNEPEP